MGGFGEPAVVGLLKLVSKHVWSRVIVGRSDVDALEWSVSLVYSFISLVVLLCQGQTVTVDATLLATVTPFTVLLALSSYLTNHWLPKHDPTTWLTVQMATVYVVGQLIHSGVFQN